MIDIMKQLSIITLLTGILLLTGCKPKPALNPDKPNIIFVVVDDLGWADLACYGADLHETPNIDRFADESLVFTNSYAAAPVCSPTRASIMTGKYPARLNFTIWSEAASVAERKNQEVYKFLPPQTIESLPAEEITLAEKLKEQGYLTAHIGKWHIGDLVHFPEAQGFDFSVAASQRGAPPTFFFPYKGQAWGELRFVGNLGRDAKGDYFTDREGEYLTDRLTDEALKIIEDAGIRPFYLNLCYYSVHTPIEAKEDDVEYFKNKLAPGLKHQNETYAGMVKSIDDNMGRLLKKIDEQGIAENTVIILISDNGGYINENRGKTVTSNFPLRSGKGSLYEGGTRIPTIISLPGNQLKGKTIDTPVSTIDFYPTLMEMVGVKDYPETDGKSFLSIMQGKQDEGMQNRALFWHYPHYYPTTTRVSAVREGDWKMLQYLEDGRVELYNLASDLGESKNLADKNPEKAAELLDKLNSWRNETNAGKITLNPKFQENSGTVK
jgi:arylsulfatase A-like enzyme